MNRYAVNTQMPIIKRGSMGNVVKIWQIIMGVEVDGEFGSMTHNATIQFQGANGLEQDGEVGPMTWSAGLKLV